MQTETINTPHVTAKTWGQTININGTDGFECYINPNGNFNSGIPSELDRQNAELIVTAVNSCKQINAANPLNVAKVLPKMFDLLNDVFDEFQKTGDISVNCLAEYLSIQSQATE